MALTVKDAVTAGISNAKNIFGEKGEALLKSDGYKELLESGKSLFDTEGMKTLSESVKDKYNFDISSADKKGFPPQIKDADMPIAGFSGFVAGAGLHSIEPNEEVVQEAYDKFSALTPEEQEKMVATYQEAVDEFQRMQFWEMTGTSHQSTNIIEFMEQHPEFKEAMEIITPLARQYNSMVQEATSEWYENAPWYEKAGSKFGISNPDRDAAIKSAQEEFLKEYPQAEKLMKMI